MNFNAFLWFEIFHTKSPETYLSIFTQIKPETIHVYGGKTLENPWPLKKTMQGCAVDSFCTADPGHPRMVVS